MKKFTKYIGLDVHKNTITVAVAEPTGVPQIWGTVENTPLAVDRLLNTAVPSSSGRRTPTWPSPMPEKPFSMRRSP